MNKITISVLELRQVLVDIKEHGHHVCVRFRLMGEMWFQSFTRVVSVTESRVLVNDEGKNKLISVDVNQVIQFEIDHRFKGWEPHFHYDVVLNQTEPYYAR